MRARFPAATAAVLALLLAACAPGDDGAALSGGPVDLQGGAPAPTVPALPVNVTVPLASPVEAPPMPLAGCPPPPRPPGTPTPSPVYVPPRLVPEAELPAALAPGQWTASLAPLEGKGMWLWRYRQSEGGNADAIVAKAVAAGLRQLWVRVGDSRDGFYAKDVLDTLVPKAHRAGISVIGWGFPFLHDPVGDAAWSAQALAWRSPDGHVLDGYSPDIELASEGVAISEIRVQVYLGLVRQAAGNRMVVATVYWPNATRWPDRYPYKAIAPYVDAFAPMAYWGCSEPGAVASQSIERLKTLRPVHAIGTGYDASVDGGRSAAPSAHETNRFLDVARRGGALGASFWVWHYMGDEQWSALSAFPWPTVGG
ncbi:MAG TPA: hypothetical protein VF045_03765 [Acidimicrobiales bacterium]